jgi:hypothetical protein
VVAWLGPLLLDDLRDDPSALARAGMAAVAARLGAFEGVRSKPVEAEGGEAEDREAAAEHYLELCRELSTWQSSQTAVLLQALGFSKVSEAPRSIPDPLPPFTCTRVRRASYQILPSLLSSFKRARTHTHTHTHASNAPTSVHT